jgi:glutamate-1-semialdehyde aminotransferase
MSQAREHYEQEAEYAQLKADNARLREALEAAIDRVTHKLSCKQIPSNFQRHNDCQCGRDAIVRQGRAALKAKGAA